MPQFAPDVWNQPENVRINNCYNYAVNDLHQAAPGTPAPTPAEPGAKHDVTAGMIVNAEPSGDGYRLYLDYTTDGIRAAAIVDGLHALDADGRCSADSWRVAYFVRHFIEGPPAISGSPHFVREDQIGQWSHKPGSLPVTQLQYNPTRRDYSGPPITDPSQDCVGPELEFGGYICCEPLTKVFSLEQREHLRQLASRDASWQNIARMIGSGRHGRRSRWPRYLKS
jgi:hypothetical protein